MHNVVYYSLHALGVIVSIIYVLRYAKSYSLEGKKTVCIFLCSYACSYTLMLLLFWAIRGRFGGQNVVRIIAFIPLFVCMFSGIFKQDRKKSLDICAPIVCICQALGKIGCQYVGCCQSWLKVPWGIMNRYTKTRLFPVQIFEGLVSAAIVIWLVEYAKKQNFDCDGLCMPYMLISFGITRFFLEFLRDNAITLFWGISELAFWALFMSMVGVVWLAIYKWRHWDPRVS